LNGNQRVQSRVLELTTKAAKKARCSRDCATTYKNATCIL
jgi:hypothetical protein